ncbi:FecR domain-containing protein [Candidatus Peregrinibacteria bacterium]|nr:FecR domain-containing protein [Candidatus Peregrinibacteria bacterium]
MKNFSKWIISVPIMTVLAMSFYVGYAADFDPLGGLSGGSGGSPNPDPQVYDLNALTDGAGEKEEVKPEEEKPEVKPGATEGADKNKSVPGDKDGEKENGSKEQGDNSSSDELSLSLAECLIMERLEIKDPKCEKMKQAFQCPDYTTCISYCGKTLDVCFGKVAKGDPNIINGNACRDHYNNACLPQCADLYKECGTKYPPEKLKSPQSAFELLDARGDVRITYENDPRASDMRSVTEDVEGLVGATIFTGDKGMVALRFSDGSNAYVGSNAYFRIDDFYTSDKFEKGNLFLKQGQVRVLINQFDSQRTKYAYVVMTPLWKAEVKGTEFIVTVDESGKVEIETVSGEVEILDFDDNLLASVAAGEKYESSPEDALEVSDDGEAFDEQIYSYEDFVNDRKVEKWLYSLGSLVVIILIGGIGYYFRHRGR